MERKVVPEALRVLRLRPDRRYTTLNRLSHEMGWRYQGVIAKLEKKRKIRAAAHYEKQKAASKLRLQAEKNVNDQVASSNKLLATYGY